MRSLELTSKARVASPRLRGIRPLPCCYSPAQALSNIDLGDAMVRNVVVAMVVPLEANASAEDESGGEHSWEVGHDLFGGVSGGGGSVRPWICIQQLVIKGLFQKETESLALKVRWEGLCGKGVCPQMVAPRWQNRVLAQMQTPLLLRAPAAERRALAMPLGASPTVLSLLPYCRSGSDGAQPADCTRHSRAACRGLSRGGVHVE